MNTPNFSAQYEKIASLKQLNENKKGWMGKNEQSFKWKQLSPCSFSTILSEQEQDDQIVKKTKQNKTVVFY